MLKWRDRIDKEDDFYPAPQGEQDLKPLISQWNTEIMSSQLLNKLVKPTDTVKTKNFIQDHLKLLKSNSDNFRVSDGFKALENTLGAEKVDILIKDKRMLDEQVRTYRERTPTYTERKKALQAEWSEKLKDTQHLIEKVSKTRKDIQAQLKAKKLEEKKKQELQQKKEEERLKKQEQEREKAKQTKLQEFEEKRKKAEEEKEKQLKLMKDYNKKFLGRISAFYNQPIHLHLLKSFSCS